MARLTSASAASPCDQVERFSDALIRQDELQPSRGPREFVGAEANRGVSVSEQAGCHQAFRGRYRAGLRARRVTPRRHKKAAEFRAESVHGGSSRVRRLCQLQPYLRLRVPQPPRLDTWRGAHLTGRHKSRRAVGAMIGSAMVTMRCAAEDWT